MSKYTLYWARKIREIADAVSEKRMNWMDGYDALVEFAEREENKMEIKMQYQDDFNAKKITFEQYVQLSKELDKQ